jgi:hypothetical protein
MKKAIFFACIIAITTLFFTCTPSAAQNGCSYTAVDLICCGNVYQYVAPPHRVGRLPDCI